MQEVQFIQISAALASLGIQQIGVSSDPDPVLGYRTWGGKDATGELTEFVARNKAAQLLRLQLTELAGAGAGVLHHDNAGTITGGPLAAGDVPDHDDLNGLTGGAPGDYNHVTTAQLAALSYAHEPVTLDTLEGPLTLSMDQVLGLSIGAGLAVVDGDLVATAQSHVDLTDQNGDPDFQHLTADQILQLPPETVAFAYDYASFKAALANPAVINIWNTSTIQTGSGSADTWNIGGRWKHIVDGNIDISRNIVIEGDSADALLQFYHTVNLGHDVPGVTVTMGNSLGSVYWRMSNSYGGKPVTLETLGAGQNFELLYEKFEAGENTFTATGPGFASWGQEFFLDTSGGKVFTSANDQRAKYLFDKIAAGSNITLALVNAGTENEALQITAAAGGVTDHGALTGLGDDDHTQYQRVCTTQVAITDYTFTGTEPRNSGYAVDSTAAARTVGIDPDLFAAGFEVSICKWTTDANTVTLDAGAGNNIDGAQTYVIRNGHETVTLIRDGADTWKVKSSHLVVPISTAGAMLYGSASGSLASLAAGAAYQGLGMNSAGTAPSWVASLQSVLTTAGDMLYASSARTPARLAKGTAYQSLNMNAGATAPAWMASLQSLMTAAGDTLYASGANTPIRLPKGVAGQVLTMNAGATAPEWQTPTGGGGSASETYMLHRKIGSAPASPYSVGQVGGGISDGSNGGYVRAVQCLGAFTTVRAIVQGHYDGYNSTKNVTVQLEESSSPNSGFALIGSSGTVSIFRDPTTLADLTVTGLTTSGKYYRIRVTDAGGVASGDQVMAQLKFY